MLKSLVAVIIVLSAAAPAHAQHLKSDEAAGKNGAPLSFVGLFQITKEVNKNRVIYEAALNASCEFNLDKPVKIYWKMGNGTTEELNFWERRAFPITFNERTTDYVTGDIKAIKDKKLRFPLTLRAGRDVNGRCTAIASAPYVAKVYTVYLSNFDGLNPKNVSVQGIDVNGQSVDLPVQRDGVSLINQIEEKKFAGAFDPAEYELAALNNRGPVATAELLARQLNFNLGDLYPASPTGLK